TPEPGIFLKIEDAQELRQIWGGIQILDFLLGNEQYPRAEAALIERLLRVFRNVHFNSNDPRSTAFSYALNWIHKRLASSPVLNPKATQHLSGLRASEEYGRALDYLFAFLRKITHPSAEVSE